MGNEGALVAVFNDHSHADEAVDQLKRAALT